MLSLENANANLNRFRYLEMPLTRGVKCVSYENFYVYIYHVEKLVCTVKIELIYLILGYLRD